MKKYTGILYAKLTRSRALALVSCLACAGVHSVPALADSSTPTYYFTLNGPTLHISPNRYNRATWGGGFAQDISKHCMFGLGQYNSSIETTSDYAAVSCDTSTKDGGWYYGFSAGLVTGYTWAPISPMLFPDVGYRFKDDTRIILAILPPTSMDKVTSINIRLEIAF